MMVVNKVHFELKLKVTPLNFLYEFLWHTALLHVAIFKDLQSNIFKQFLLFPSPGNCCHMRMSRLTTTVRYQQFRIIHSNGDKNCPGTDPRMTSYICQILHFWWVTLCGNSFWEFHQKLNQTVKQHYHAWSKDNEMHAPASGISPSMSASLRR